VPRGFSQQTKTIYTGISLAAMFDDTEGINSSTQQYQIFVFVKSPVFVWISHRFSRNPQLVANPTASCRCSMVARDAAESLVLLGDGN
jgi:hypothetical protein